MQPPSAPATPRRPVARHPSCGPAWGRRRRDDRRPPAPWAARNALHFPGGGSSPPERADPARRPHSALHSPRLAAHDSDAPGDTDRLRHDHHHDRSRHVPPRPPPLGVAELDCAALERHLCGWLRPGDGRSRSASSTGGSSPSLCSRCAQRDRVGPLHRDDASLLLRRVLRDQPASSPPSARDVARTASHRCAESVVAEGRASRRDRKKRARRRGLRMLLPWSSAADKLASGLQTPRSVRRGSKGNTEMCVQNGMAQFTDITPGQFGLTKQLVLRITLPHISLILISIGYALAGCWILTAINYKADSLEAMQLVNEAKSRFVSRVVGQVESGSERPDAAQLEQGFARFSADLYEVYSRFPRSTAVLDMLESSRDGHETMRGPLTNVTWNLFFVATTLTSIGYGANAPDSVAGRLFCVLYILLGIPLYLITLADLAKFCTEFMNRTYTEYLKLAHGARARFRRRRQRAPAARDSLPDRVGELDVHKVIIAGGEEEVAEFLWTHLENTQFVEIPFVLIYLILLSYIAAASYLIAYLEEWSTQKGFYFVMMSVLTIGFGDVVPNRNGHVMLILAILLLGLIITTTCIDIVGAYYIDQLHFFGRRIDVEDPLLWLKAVQQKRIDAMKREAMRKLFETVAALNRMHFDSALLRKQLADQLAEKPEAAMIKMSEMTEIFEPPNPPRGLAAFKPTADSICLRWDAPVSVEEGRRFWYTLSFKTRTPEKQHKVTVVDFINQTHYRLHDLKSFTLYEFSVVTTTRYGASKPVKCQEYTEPCTVPQSIRLEEIGPESATISWKAPRKNKGPESYIILYAREPAPHVSQWPRFRVGRAKRFTLSDLSPESNYICGVSAEHNSGLATLSKTFRFRTRGFADGVESVGDNDQDSVLFNWAAEQVSRTPTPTRMWKPQPFLAQLQNALHTHLLSSPLRLGRLGSRSRDPSYVDLSAVVNVEDELG